MLPNRALVSCCSIPATDKLTAWQQKINRMFIFTMMTAVFLLLGLKSISQTVVMLEVNGKPYKAGKAVLFGQPAVNLDQAGNGKYDAVQDPMQWQNGNLNPNQAHYIEHHSIPYRLIMTDMPVGTEVTLTMNFDFVNSKKYAIDFLTGYQQLQPHNYVNHTTEETVNPLAPGAFSAPTSELVIPAPGYLNAGALTDFNGLPAEDRKISIWGANFNTGASIVYTPDPNILVLDNVNKKVSWTVKFTPSAATVTLAWGGHIASRDDWGFDAVTGEPNSAGGISGSPYHMRTQGWSLGNIGNQDRSLQVALAAPTCPTSLIPSGTTTITYNPDNGHYEICPNTPATFSVGVQPAGTTYVWSVTGDATAQGSNTQPNFTVLTAKKCGSFTVTVQLQNGSGFVTNCSVTVYVVDTVKPTISLNGVDQGIDGSKTDFKECDQNFPVLSGLTYSDNCNADIAGSGGVTVSDWVIEDVHTTIDGKCVTQKATKKWTVVDYCGNVNTFTYIVYSIDTKAPFITGLASSDVVQCNTQPAFSTPQAGDACDPSPTLDHTDSQEPMGNCVTKYIRTWIATDWCGNKSTPVSQYFLIRNDNTPPTVTIEATRDLGCNPTSIVFDEPQVSDDCGTPTLVQGYPTTGEVLGTCNKTQTKTWKYVDACGNVTEKSQTLKWKDDKVAPELSAKPANASYKCYGDVPAAPAITANDLCDGALDVKYETSESKPGSSCGNTITRTWSAVDGCGNSVTYTQTITVNDDVKPTVSQGPGDNKNLGCNPENINANFGTPGFADNCDKELTVSSNDVDGGEPCARTRTRTWTATDDCGNSVSVSQTLSWKEDKTAPVLSAKPADASYKCLGDVPAAPAVTANDNCDGATAVKYEEKQSSPGSSCNNTITRTWSAIDGCGNSVTYTQTITVNDDVKPTVSQGPGDNKNLGCNPENINANFGTPSFADNCDKELTVSSSDVDGGEPCAKTRTRTWTATDDCGNSVSVSQTLSWKEDKTAPVLSAKPADASYKCLGDVPAAPAVTANDNCDGATAVKYEEKQSNPGSSCNNTITRTWSATDKCGNTVVYTQTITVNDDVKPEVIDDAGADKDLGCNPTDINSNFVDPLFGDNCDKELTVSYKDVDGGEPCARTRTRTWTATDDCGNTATADQKLTWKEDKTAPVLSAKPADASYKCLGDVPAAPAVTANDNCDGATDVKYEEKQSNPGSSCNNTITRTWSATDKCGNTVVYTQTITVNDDVKPTVSQGPGDNKNLGCNPENINANFGTPSFADNCDKELSVSSSDVDGGEPCARTRTRTWTATDDCGNSVSVSQTLSWKEDKTAPVLSAKPADASYKCLGDVPAAPAVTANDNCDGATAVKYEEKQSNPGSSCNNTITRTWSATDKCGNTVVYTQTITVNDDVKPTVSQGPGDNKNLGCNPENINANFGTPSFADNCDKELTVSSSDVDGGEPCAKTRTRTWTATDDCGNSVSVSQTLSWKEDKTAPVLSAKPADASYKCYGDVPAAPAVTANDNCDGAVDVKYEEKQSNPGSSCNNTITRTWSATDKCGNTVVYTQTITVNDDVKPEVIDDAGADKDLGCNPTDINSNFVDPLFGDNCDKELTVSYKDVDGGDACNKWRVRTWTATDDCGNTATADQKLTWKEDKTAPTFDNVPADAEYECGTTIPDAPAVTATDNCDGTIKAKYEGQSDLIAGDCGVYYFFRNWSVTDACGNSATAQQKITIKPLPPVFMPESLPDPEVTVECGTENAVADPQATVCTPTGEVPATIIGPEKSPVEVVDACTKKYTLTWTAIYPGIPNCPQPPATQFTQTVYIKDTQKPTISGLPTDAVVSIKCDQELPAPPTVTATDACDPEPKVVYEQTGPVAKNCVDGIKETYTRTWYAVDACGNKTETFTQTINVLCCEAYCTYTQGYYGNPGGKSCDGTTGGYSTKELINKALGAWPGPSWTIGKPGRGIVINDVDADWIINYLPGGGASKALKPGDCQISDATCMKFNLRNGKINNTLLAQTITLGLNMGVKSNLSSLALVSGKYLNTGDLEGGCGTTTIKSCKYDIYGNVTYSPYHSYMLPASVIDYLSSIGKANVAGLFELANNLLGGDAAPAGVTLDAVASAEDIINNAFDQCRGFAGWSAQPATCPAIASGVAAPTNTMVSAQRLAVTAFPNPYDETITFVINSPESGRGKLNLFNMRGEQVSTVFDGNVEANRTMTISYKVPPLHRTNLVYHFSIGKKVETGKLVRPN